jgi:DNA-binding GntR family transcriptional regulator
MDAMNKAQSSPERVAATITKGVLRRRYLVGQRLVEAELTAELGVGRSTVREALKILAGNGVVEIVPHRGALIRGLTLSDSENLLDVLEVLTGLAARAAAEKIDRGTNRKLFTDAARPLIEPSDSQQLGRILDDRARFYQVMLQVADNAELERAMPLGRAHLFRTQFYSYVTKADLRAMVGEYRNITNAILGGDGSKAEIYARRHIRKTAERTLPHLR